MPQLVDPTKCTGCSACANICRHNAIGMTEDEEGFLRPMINGDKCTDCKLCENVCPELSSKKTTSDKQKVFALWSEIDRKDSSSGGAFSAFARYVLMKGGVVFGTVYDKNLRVFHSEIKNVDGLAAMRGSKYIQSSIGDTYRKIKDYLQTNTWVLFSGTPCQVAGLRSFLKKDYECLLTLDLICHGVPSYKIFKSYIEKLKQNICITNKGQNIDNYKFRQRDGWGFAPSISLSGNYKMLYGVDALYMEAFNAGAIFRNSCYKCNYSSTNRVGDCTIGDFWGLGLYGTPFEYNTKQGVSLVICNNDKGLQILKELSNVFTQERTLEEATIENHNLTKTSVRHRYRDEIVKAFINPNTSLKDIDAQYHLVDKSIKSITKKWASNLGLFSIAKSVYDFYKKNK